jgi:hypothetical protein
MPFTYTQLNLNDDQREIPSSFYYIVDTRLKSLFVKLPKNPSIGDPIFLFDGYHSFLNNPLILCVNGNRIMGVNENLICDVNGAHLGLIFTGGEEGWSSLPLCYQEQLQQMELPQIENLPKQTNYNFSPKRWINL